MVLILSDFMLFISFKRLPHQSSSSRYREYFSQQMQLRVALLKSFAITSFTGQLNIRHKYHLYIDRAFSLQVSQRPASTLKEKCLADTFLF
jgi:hypothetical protein